MVIDPKRHPENLTNEEIHTSRRQTLVRGIGTGFIARIVTAVSPLLMVPLALGYMGQESYAIWTAAISLTALAIFADLGLGQGLMTLLTPRIVKAEWPEARRLVSSAYSTLTVVAVMALVGISLTIHRLNWSALLGFPPNPTHDWIVVACLSGFIINIPLSLVVRVQYATQRVALANAWQATGPLLSIGSAVVAVVNDWGSLMVVVGALVGPIIANCTASVHFFSRHPHLRPTLVIPSRLELASLLGLGAGYLLLNVTMAAAVNVDVILVSRSSDAAAVVAFGLALRVFSQLGALVSMANAPLWPVNAEAIARGDWQWVRKMTRKMTTISLAVVAIPSIVLILAGPALFTLWTGQDIEISRVLLGGAALYWLLVAGLSPLFMVQNSVGRLMPQLVGWILFLLLSLPLKLYLLSTVGWNWIALSSFAVATVTLLPGALWGYRTAQSKDKVRTAESRISANPRSTPLPDGEPARK